MKELRESPGLEMLAKVDAVITALSDEPEMSAADIASRVGEPVSSTYRLISNLVRLGWLSKGSRRGLYRLGLFFMRVGGYVEDTLDIRQLALPHLRALLDATGQTSYLCILQDVRAVCIERLEGGEVRSLELTIGSSLPLVIGGAPKAMLAFLPQSEYERVVQTDLRDDSTHRVPTRERLDREVVTIRARHYAVSDGDVTAGVAAIGAPVFNHRGEMCAAVSASGIREHILGRNREAVIEATRRCAAATSLALGWRGAL